MSGRPTYFDGPEISIEFNADTDAHLRCIVNTSGKAVIAGAADKSVGVAWLRGVDVSEDARGTLRLNQVGTQIMVASEAITKGALVYAAADGKVATTGTVLEGRAMSAAGADGDYISVEPMPANGVLAYTVTVDSSQASANSATVDTGLGVELTHAIVQVYGSAGGLVAHSSVTFGSGGNAGQITVAATSLTLNDEIVILVPVAALAI